MSDSIEIVCKDCKQSLWIGQFPYGRPDRAFVYGSPGELALIARFAVAHIGHNLTIADDKLLQSLETEEWIEITGPPEAGADNRDAHRAPSGAADPAAKP